MMRVYGMKVLYLNAGDLTDIAETEYDAVVETRFAVRSQPRP
ncbi:hypothetical protein [Salinimicrobium marinum]|nr:hypothetical protein [Salinimicrobium marinum]